RCRKGRVRRVGSGVAGQDRPVDVARILEQFGAESEPFGRNDERIYLITARRSMRTDLIVERHDVVTIERAEQNAISRVRLPHQGLDRAQHVRLRAKNLERTFTEHELELTVAQKSSPAL